MDSVVVILYLLVMLGVGWYSRRRARNEADFLVAGRRLEPVLYACTMAALVILGSLADRPVAAHIRAQWLQRSREPAVTGTADAVTHHDTTVLES